MSKRTLAGIIVMSVLIMGCKPQSITPSTPLETPPASPLNDTSPLPTQLAPDAQATAAIALTAYFGRQATAAAEATAYTEAHAPTPIPATATPLPDGTTCYVNRLAHFTLKLLPGWHTERIWDIEYNVPFYNYDSDSFGSEEPLPPHLAKIDLSVYPLADHQSFEQWLNERLAFEGTSAPISLTLSEPYSYTLGKYHGVAYTAAGYGDESLIIKLTDGKKVADIGLISDKSPALDEALAMLSTLDISDKETCK